jgi:DNA-binding SARP family transcriptional activator/ABC-type transport system substrate-binding protein
VELPAGKQRGLLVLLALQANRGVAREAIIDALWGDEPPASVWHTVEVYVSRLRKVLAGCDATVETLPSGYLLRVSSDSVDLTRFEALVAKARVERESGEIAAASGLLHEALGMWRGDALADVRTLPFAKSEAARLDDLRLAALEDRFETDVELGRHAGVVAEVGVLVAQHPERERLWRTLMLALYRSGRQQEALDVYTAWRRDLRDRLGLEPSPETRELERLILTHDPALRPDIGESPTAPEPTTNILPSVPTAGRKRSSRRSHWVVTALAAAGVVAALLLALIAIRPGNGTTSHAAQRAVALSTYSITDVAKPASIDVGGPVSAMVTGFGALWVATTRDDVVVRVDPRRDAVLQTIPTGRDPVALAIDSASVWVASADGTVTQVSPTLNLPIRTITIGGHPDGICAYAGAVWVTEPGPVLGGTLVRIDPTSGAFHRFALGGEPGGVVGAYGSLWVSQSAAATVARIAPGAPSRTPRIVHTADGSAALAVGADAIWVANRDAASVFEIDPRSNSVSKTYTLAGAPASVSFSGGRVWVAVPTAHAVYTIDPDTGHVSTVSTTGSPSDLAVVGGHIWVGNAASSAAHAGGTLLAAFRLLNGYFSVDPANADISVPVVSLTNDGLVSYREAPGVAGNSLVPDLATALPSVSANGRAYVFHLRPGIRYSTGQPVRVEDFRAALERAYRLPFAAVDDQADSGYVSDFDALRGATACQVRPKRCDLSRAVVTNDRTRTITIHLRYRDPEFLYALAGSAADLLPPGTPVRGIVPATGPYRIESATKARIVLRRNPYFHSWSSEARPAGFAERIVLMKASPADAVRGSVDVVVADQGENSLATLARRHPRQVLPVVLPAGWWMTPNTQEPPFTSPLARRAVVVALNSSALAAAQPGGTVFWQPTCHVLSTPLVPYPRTCPTAQGQIALARHLVIESGTHGMRVVVWSFNYYPGFAHYFARLLNQIGYRATAEISPTATKYFTRVSDSRTHTQISLQTWVWGDPTGAILTRFFTCKAYLPANPSNVNNSEFCDPTIDRQMATAARADAKPAAAWPQWAKIDDNLVRHGAVVPGLTPLNVAYLSRRLGNLATNWNGLMLDQTWVR